MKDCRCRTFSSTMLLSEGKENHVSYKYIESHVYYNIYYIHNYVFNKVTPDQNIF